MQLKIGQYYTFVNIHYSWGHFIPSGDVTNSSKSWLTFHLGILTRGYIHLRKNAKKELKKVIKKKNILHSISFP